MARLACPDAWPQTSRETFRLQFNFGTHALSHLVLQVTNNLVQRHVRCVDSTGIVGANQRAIPPYRIELVTLSDLLKYFSFINVHPRTPNLISAPTSADLRVGVKVELDVGIGKHDRSLIPPLRDKPLMFTANTLLRSNENFTNRAYRSDRADARRYIGIAQASCDIDVIDVKVWRIGRPVEPKMRIACEIPRPIGIRRWIDTRIDTQRRHATIHCARVKEFQPQLFGQTASNS